MDELEILLKCNICNEIFNKPTILNCGHMACWNCAKNCKNCPECAKKLWAGERKETKVMAMWHVGGDVVDCFNHNRKDSDAIISSLKKALKCPICVGIIYEAAVTNCGHVYCGRCLSSWMASHEDCPVCRSKVMAVFTWPLGNRLAQECRRRAKRAHPEDDDDDEYGGPWVPKKRRYAKAAAITMAGSLLVGSLAWTIAVLFCP